MFSTADELVDYLKSQENPHAPLVLQPAGSPKLGTSDEIQQFMIEWVERQLENPARTIRYVNDRGVNDFRVIMEFRRSVMSFNELNKSILKWVMLTDLLGITYMGRSGRSYIDTAHQYYTGAMHADGGASVQFIPANSTIAEKPYYAEAKEKCLYYFTPELHDMVSSFMETTAEFVEGEPGIPLSRYASRLSGGGSGWATSR